MRTLFMSCFQLPQADRHSGGAYKLSIIELERKNYRKVTYNFGDRNRNYVDTKN